MAAWRYLPNALSVARMLLTVPLAWWIRDGKFDAAVVLCVVAGLSDALDGFLAKRYGWESWLGGILDPLADKLLLLAGFAMLALNDDVPRWLAGLVIGRDAVIVGGALLYHFAIGRVTAEPSRVSKFTTCVQIAFVLGTLLHLSQWAQWPMWFNVGLLWLTVAATAMSGVDYVLRWSGRAWRATHERGPQA